jgi:hypothetical protein
VSRVRACSQALGASRWSPSESALRAAAGVQARAGRCRGALSTNTACVVLAARALRYWLHGGHHGIRTAMGAGRVKTEGARRVMVRRRPLAAENCQRHWSPVAQGVRKGKRNFATSTIADTPERKPNSGPRVTGPVWEALMRPDRGTRPPSPFGYRIPRGAASC